LPVYIGYFGLYIVIFNKMALIFF